MDFQQAFERCLLKVVWSYLVGCLIFMYEDIGSHGDHELRILYTYVIFIYKYSKEQYIYIFIQGFPKLVVPNKYWISY